MGAGALASEAALALWQRCPRSVSGKRAISLKNKLPARPGGRRRAIFAASFARSSERTFRPPGRVLRSIRDFIKMAAARVRDGRPECSRPVPSRDVIADKSRADPAVILTRCTICFASVRVAGWPNSFSPFPPDPAHLGGRRCPCVSPFDSVTNQFGTFLRADPRVFAWASNSSGISGFHISQSISKPCKNSSSAIPSRKEEGAKTLLAVLDRDCTGRRRQPAAKYRPRLAWFGSVMPRALISRRHTGARSRGTITPKPCRGPTIRVLILRASAFPASPPISVLFIVRHISHGSSIFRALHPTFRRKPESSGFVLKLLKRRWIPAFAGMTVLAPCSQPGSMNLRNITIVIHPAGPAFASHSIIIKMQVLPI